MGKNGIIRFQDQLAELLELFLVLFNFRSLGDGCERIFHRLDKEDMLEAIG